MLPVGRIDAAIQLASTEGVVLCCYGDVMRVPGSRRASLLQARAGGADVRVVYSVLEALRVAQDDPAREVVFFAIGFETTTPPTAHAVLRARDLGLANFSVFCNHVLTPAAIRSILDSPDVRELGTLPIDGFVGPSHVSVVIGSRPFEYFAEEYQKPVVVAGFEPVDVMEAVLMLVRQVNEGRYEVENQYSRAVTREGNRHLQALVAEVFALRKRFEWRGLGVVPYSALGLAERFAGFDAERRFELPDVPVPDHPLCECGAILRGVKEPVDCKLFGTACTPEHPLGSCMVSPEGACAARWTYRRFAGQAGSPTPAPV